MKKFLRNHMHGSIVELLRKGMREARLLSLALAEKSSVFGKFYYVLLSSKFSSEHQAVLAGRREYYRSLEDIGKSSALLRRNIHRLEKGIIMRPRRDTFAEGFIIETVDCFKKAVNNSQLDPREIKWAYDVLEEYFFIVKKTPDIACANEVFEDVKALLPKIENSVGFSPINGDYKPYPYSALPSANVKFDDLKDLYIKRRSVRWYLDKHVPRDLVEKAANIASSAPSACNRQPYRFLFCNQKDKVSEIAKCAGGTVGFAENLPSLIVVVGDLSAYPFERDRHLIYIDGSLASMQLMLALQTLELSTCPINWPDVKNAEKEIRQIIDLEDYERVVMLIAVGFADNDGGIPYSQKKQNRLILEDISA